MRIPLATLSARRPGLLLSGCAAAAVAASLVAPQSAHGQAFNGAPTYMTPDVSVSNAANSSTITTAAPTGIIDWTVTSDTGAPFVFLPGTNTATYTSAPGGNDYIILNRIFGDVATTPMQFNGTVVSQINNGGVSAPGGTVWFYTPGGIVVGAGAVFNVGSLILTSQEILTIDTNSDGDPDEIDFGTGPNNQIQFAAAIADSTSSVTIQPGATINAANIDGSYVALVAPRIDMGGNVQVDGSAAYIAAEDLTIDFDILINDGLFDINISTGAFTATSGEQVIAHTGATGGPSSAAAGDNHAIYMVAMPKNDAVTMLVSGSLGYQPAVMAGVENGVIYLSAGTDGFAPVIADLAPQPGSGISTPGATQGGVDIADAIVTSRLQAFASDAITLTSNIPGSSFDLDVALFAGNAVSVVASDPGNMLQFGGDLVIAVNNSEQGGYAEIRTENGGAIGIQGDLLVDVSDAVAFADGVEQGGSAVIQAEGGNIVVSGNASIDASGAGDGGYGYSSQGANGIGGSVSISATGSDILISGDLTARADGIGADYFYYAGNGTGGTIGVYASGGTIQVSGVGGLDLDASGFGGDGSQGTGYGYGGQIFINSETYGLITIADALTANANGIGGTAQGGGIDGGTGNGSLISVIATDAEISTGTMALDASAQGGDGGPGGAGGVANGGTVIVTSTSSDAIGPPPGDFAADLMTINVDATGGGIDSTLGNEGGNGGDATAGTVLITADSRIGRRSAGAPAGETLDISADAFGGAGGNSAQDATPGGAGGNAAGGTIDLALVDGTLDFPAIVGTADGIGGIGGNYIGTGPNQLAGAGGNGSGGTTTLFYDGGDLLGDTLSLFAGGTGGDGGNSNTGGGGSAGTGTGGSVLATFAAPATTTTLSSLAMFADASGGIGGVGTGVGGNGGGAIGGIVELVIAGNASLETGNLGLGASGFGGGPGIGAGGAGAGGNAAGGSVGLIGDVGSGQFTATDSEITADAAGGQPQAGNSPAGDADAGTIDIASTGSQLNLGSGAISATGTSTDGASTGGGISLTATGGRITSGAIDVFANGLNVAGTGQGGTVAIAAMDDGVGNPGTMALGATSLSAHGASSVAGQSTAGNISINNIATNPSSAVSFASLDAQALGDNAAIGPAIQIGADTAPIIVAGNANFEGTGDVIFHLTDTGFFDATAVTVTATGVIEVTHFSPAAGSDALIARNLVAMTAGFGILVEGGILVDSAGAGDGVFLDGQNAIRVFTPTGNIRVLDGSGELGGAIGLTANDIAIGSSATFVALDGSASIEEREAILGANAGPVNTDGYLQADAITLTGGDSIHIQNSGVSGGLPDQRAGFTAGSGGLTIQTNGIVPTEIIINGRIVDGSSVITGRDVIDAATIQASGGGAASFADASTIDSCLILGGNCIDIPPPPPPAPPDTPTVDIVVQDLIEEEIEEDDDDPTETPRRRLMPLVETVELGANREGPIIDDPVTGTGNDDLWLQNSPGGGSD